MQTVTSCFLVAFFVLLRAHLTLQCYSKSQCRCRVPLALKTFCEKIRLLKQRTKDFETSAKNARENFRMTFHTLRTHQRWRILQYRRVCRGHRCSGATIGLRQVGAPLEVSMSVLKKITKPVVITRYRYFEGGGGGGGCKHNPT